MNKIAKEMTKLAKSLIARKLPLTPEEGEWYKKVLAHIKRLSIDTQINDDLTFSSVDTRKSSNGNGIYLVIEADIDGANLAVEVDTKTNDIDVSLALPDLGEDFDDLDGGSESKRGVDWSRPNDTIKMIDKVVKEGEKWIRFRYEELSSAEAQKELEDYDYGRHQ